MADPVNVNPTIIKGTATSIVNAEASGKKTADSVITAIGDGAFSGQFTARTQEIAMTIAGSRRSFTLNGHNIQVPRECPPCRLVLKYELQDNGDIKVALKCHAQTKIGGEITPYVAKFKSLTLPSKPAGSEALKAIELDFHCVENGKRDVRLKPQLIQNGLGISPQDYLIYKCMKVKNPIALASLSAQVVNNRDGFADALKQHCEGVLEKNSKAEKDPEAERAQDIKRWFDTLRIIESAGNNLGLKPADNDESNTSDESEASSESESEHDLAFADV